MALEGIRRAIASKVESIRADRAEEAKIRSEIRQRVAEVSRKERITQAERLTRERIKIATEREIKALKGINSNGRAQQVQSIIGNSLFGSAPSSNPVTGKVKYRVTKKKKGKRTIVTRTAIVPKQTQPQQRRDIFGSFGSSGNSGRFNAITGRYE